MTEVTPEEIEEYSTKLYALQPNKLFSMDVHPMKHKIMAVMASIDARERVFRWDDTRKNIMRYKMVPYHELETLPEGIRIERVNETWVTFEVKGRSYNERCPAHYKIWNGDKLIAIESIKK